MGLNHYLYLNSNKFSEVFVEFIKCRLIVGDFTTFYQDDNLGLALNYEAQKKATLQQ
jgi:hypothetical protein